MAKLKRGLSSRITYTQLLPGQQPKQKRRFTQRQLADERVEWERDRRKREQGWSLLYAIYFSYSFRFSERLAMHRSVVAQEAGLEVGDMPEGTGDIMEMEYSEISGSDGGFTTDEDDEASGLSGVDHSTLADAGLNMAQREIIGQ
jgi:hypothetical protein